MSALTDHYKEGYSGNLTCYKCQSKRLTATSFSKAAVQNHIKNFGGEESSAGLVCLICKEKEIKAGKPIDDSTDYPTSNIAAPPARLANVSSIIQCKSCLIEFPPTSYSNSQLQKLTKSPTIKINCKECMV